MLWFGLTFRCLSGGFISSSSLKSLPLIYLNSRSPRRARLLEQMDIRFIKVDCLISEEIKSGEKARDYVIRMSKEKAIAGLQTRGLTLGADTIVVLKGSVIGKPCNIGEARETLAKLSGQEHFVLTAVSAYDGKKLNSVMVESRVKIKNLSKYEIDSYCATGEPLDKAGSYGIQGVGGVFVESMAGSYSGIVGLPIKQTEELLLSFDIDTWKGRAIR